MRKEGVLWCGTLDVSADQQGQARGRGGGRCRNVGVGEGGSERWKRGAGPLLPLHAAGQLLGCRNDLAWPAAIVCSGAARAQAGRGRGEVMPYKFCEQAVVGRSYAL